MQVLKRDGRKVEFDKTKIEEAITKAAIADKMDLISAKAVGKRITQAVVFDIQVEGGAIIDIEEVQDIVEEALMEKHPSIAKAYILYREKRTKMRRVHSKSSVALVTEYLKSADWRIKENSNMGFSLQGLNNYIASDISQEFWLNEVYNEDIRKAHATGDMHVHDLGLLGSYCVGWDLQDLLRTGFTGVPGKISSKPAKHFRTALGQIVNFFYTLQGEAAGAQALSSFDTLLAPFIRNDKLEYGQVKQAMQEFIFNLNVPTRVGFQCLSEDTEILTPEGWAGIEDVEIGDDICTYNTDNKSIEILPTTNVFSREYEGEMYSLKNRITDQLISPKHRVVRYKNNTDELSIEPIEDVLLSKSPLAMPVSTEGLSLSEAVDPRMVKLSAWVVTDGSADKHGRGTGRITIYQSEAVHKDKYDRIKGLLEDLEMEHTEREMYGWGSPCKAIRLSAEASSRIYKFFESDKLRGVKFIPRKVMYGGRDIAKMFIEEYLLGDGTGNKTSTVFDDLRDDLMQLCVYAGWSATAVTRFPKEGGLNKQPLHVIRIIQTEKTFVKKEGITKVDYKGRIWCPTTSNGTVIARRNGKIFITGNCPFTNLTMDMVCPSTLKDVPVVIGGEDQDSTYSEYQEEMDMLNRAFAEVMVEGDASGRIFTFPIPTYNIFKGFDWDSARFDPVWKMAGKYGVPSFANFINSDLNPEDSRSFCCRLRLDVRELRKRGGGLFGANPLTGSLGVVTINLPRIGYDSKDEQEFFKTLEERMNLAKDSLCLKRKAVEEFTEDGLYPYTKFYLRAVKERFGKYWANHFGTIGLLGMNEACLNLFGKDIASEEGKGFAERVLAFMRNKMSQYQEETGDYFNLEATPAEGTSFRLALLDKRSGRDMIFANGKAEDNKTVYYTNSSQLPVGYTDDIFVALDHQDDLQALYTGGTTFHGFLGEAVDNPETVKQLVKTIAENYKLPYFDLTPTFSICGEHGYLSGEIKECPKCGEETEVYSRVVGYYRPVNAWNEGKAQEFKDRKEYALINE